MRAGNRLGSRLQESSDVVRQFEEFPHWEFTVSEVTDGVYRVRALRDGGISGEATDPDPDTAIEGLRTWAHKVEKDLEARADGRP
jgi:hypothetical protein